MFKFPRRRRDRVKFFFATACNMGIEPLEGRQLLSAAHHHATPVESTGGFSQVLNSIEFSQTPAAVQTGLDTLAADDNLTAPTATQTVKLDNIDGVETYSLTIDGTGTATTLTVDENGNPVTKPALSKTTFGTLSGTGVGSDSAAATEISAIATALDLNAPSSSTVVKVTTYSDGIVTYSVNLTGATGHHHQAATTISVDGDGNPVGNQTLPFDVIPTAIQNALNSNAPSGATDIASTSTENVKVETADGVTTYSVNFDVSGTNTTVTVNSSGQLTSLPSYSTTEFSDIPTAAQTELQTLATDYGVTGTISATQKIEVYTESNGTVVYAAKLSASGTNSHGNSFMYAITIAVDEDGNPTTIPGGTNGRGSGGGGGEGCDGDVLDGSFGFGPSELFLG
ncbi:MAG TPA: hypothetical protein VL992_04435 [Tepidisphaeraceae bacterium]|nr:hypothetical protein [Tepidisphaeraceae bacterium]